MPYMCNFSYASKKVIRLPLHKRKTVGGGRVHYQEKRDGFQATTFKNAKVLMLKTKTFVKWCFIQIVIGAVVKCNVMHVIILLLCFITAKNT